MSQATASLSTKKDVLAEFRRTAILDAACRAFARSGYDATTVDMIAGEADIAKGTVYLYYKSKAEIYHAAVSHGLHELHADTEQAMERATGCRDKIEQFIRLRAEYVEQHRDFYRIYLSEFTGALKSPTPIQREMQQLADRQTELLERAIVKGVAKKEIRRVPPKATALAIFDLSRGLLRNRLNGLVEVERPIDYQAVLDLLWNGLRPHK